jgi:hypothetical protein
MRATMVEATIIGVLMMISCEIVLKKMKYFSSTPQEGVMVREATIIVVLLLSGYTISPTKQTTTSTLLVFFIFYKQPLNLLNYFIYFSLSKMRGESSSHRACQILCDPFSRLSPP